MSESMTVSDHKYKAGAFGVCCTRCGLEEPQHHEERQYPEHEKFKKISHLSQAQGEFIDWLESEKRIVLAEFGERYLCTVQEPVQKLLAEFHGIDLNKIEDEKRAMLEELREAQ